MSNEILTAVSNGEPFSKGPRKGKAPAAGGSKRTSTSLPAQKTKRNHEKFTPLPDIPACNFAEAFTAVRQSPAWSAAVEHAEDPSRGGCGCQFQISNTNKVFTGMYKLVGPRCYRKYTFKEGYQPQIVRWDDGDSCWIMAQPVDGTMTTYFQSRCNDDRMPLDTWEAVHDAAGQPPTIEVLIGNSKKSSEMCSSCKVRESYHTVYYGPQENTKPACDGGSGTAPEVGMKGQRQKHSDFCEACGLSVSNHTVYHGSKINGGGIGLAIFKLFPPCHARKNWRLSVNREVCLDAPVPMETERTAAPSQSSRRKRGPDSLSGDEQQIFNALASLVERRGFDFVRHAVNSLEGNGPPSSKRVKVEVGAEEVGPREEGSIIVRFVAPLSADGWWPMSSFERWIEQAGSASITEAASVKLQYAVASISSKTGGDLSTAKLNLKLKFDANFRDTTHHAKIDTLNIPAQLQSWLDRAGETFKFHEKAVKAFTSVFRSKVGKIRLGELLLDAAKVVFPNSRFPSEVYFAAPEARRKQSNPPSYDEITSSEPPPAYVPLSIAQPPETSAEMLETTAEQHHSSTVDVIDEDPSALSDTATSSTADGDDTSPASFDNAELGFGLSPQQEAHDGEDDIEWLLEEEARRATAQQQQGRSHPRRSPRKRVPAS